MNNEYDNDATGVAGCKTILISLVICIIIIGTILYLILWKTNK